MHPGQSRVAVYAALGAAILFGASTPLAKLFVPDMSAFMLAGLLYLGSGIGLTTLRLVRDRGWHAPALRRDEWPWLLGAIAFGGVAGPVLLMLGLARTSASNASLLLNLETVMTALLAWLLFRENVSRRVLAGMFSIVIGGLLLSWPDARTDATAGGPGVVLIAVACLCWAIDNNMTRRVSSSDALFIAGVKGMVAAVINIGLALSAGQTLPPWTVGAPVMAVGFFGYGISLALFVVALRGLGAARTAGYFGCAPFIGAALAITIFQEHTSLLFWSAGLFMAGGLWLHLSEHHAHPHWHGELFHSHPHFPDVAHRHEHH